MTRRPTRRTQTHVPAVEDSPKVTEPEVVVPAKKGKVTVVLILGNGLVHPCGTRLLPNDPMDIPDDSWTKAQMDSGLLRVK